MQIIMQIVMVEYIVQFQCVFISNFKNIVCLIHYAIDTLIHMMCIIGFKKFLNDLLLLSQLTF